LVLLALCVAGAAATTPVTDIAYVPGKEYVYSYETITTTAFTTTVNQIAALKVKTDVHLLTNAQHVVTAKLLNPVVCKLNQEVEIEEPIETVLERSCTPLSGAELQEVVQELTKPFKFMWESGIVSELRVPQEEKYWSVNIKRGLLNLLQINLNKEHIIPSLPEELVTIVRDDPTFKTLFRTYERDMVGECETIYALKDKEVDTPIWTLNKVHNYDNCKTLPMYRTGLFANLKVNEKLPIKPMSQCDYELAGNRQNFLINKVMRKTYLSFVPFGVKNGETAYTYIIQKMVLKTALSTPSTIRTPAFMTVVPALEMEIPTESTNDMLEIPTNELPLMMNKVNDILEEVVLLVTPEISETVPEKITDLVHIMKMLPLREMKTIINTHCRVNNLQVEMKKREIILDILPTLPRDDLVEILKYCLDEKLISTPRMSIMLTMMATTAKPSIKLFDDLMELVKDPIVTESAMLKKSVLLCCGILANKMKNVYIEMGTDRHVYVPELHGISQKIITELHACRTVEEKLLVVSVIGNSGLLELVPELEKLILDITTPVPVKTKAIFALKKMIPFIPKKVQQLVLPIFLDTTMPVELRLSCFLITMKTNPETDVFSLILHTIKSETNIEVLSFVDSYLKNLATKDCHCALCPCYTKVVNAKLILEEIQNIHTGIMTSKFIKMEKLIAKYGVLGAEMDLALMNLGNSPVPEKVILNYLTSLMGIKIDVAELGIDIHGLKNIIWNLMGPINKYEDLMSGEIEIEELLKPITELLQRIVTIVEPIRNKFPTTERKVPEVLLNMYFKMFGYEILNTNLKEEDLNFMIREVMTKLPTIVREVRNSYNLNLVKSLVITDSAQVIPTPCGLPLIIRTDGVGMIGLQGNLRFEGLETLQQFIRAPQINTLPLMKIFTDLKTSSLMSTAFTVRIGLPFVKVMTKLKVDFKHILPVKSEVILNLPERKFNIVAEPIKTTTKLMEFRVTPMTSIKMLYKTFIPRTCGYSIEDVPVTVLPKVLATVNKLENTLLPVVFRYETPSIFKIDKPNTWFLCPFMVESTWIPTTTLPTHYEIEMKYFGNTPFPQLNTLLKFDPITEEPGMLMNTKKEVVVTLKTVGAPTVEELLMKICYIPSTTLLKHQLNVQMLLQTINNPLKVVFNNILSLPEYLLKPLPMTEITEPVYKADVFYGVTDAVEKFTTLELFMHREESPLGTYSDLYPMHILKHFTLSPSDSIRPDNVLTDLRETKFLTGVTEMQSTARPLVLTAELEYTNALVPTWMKFYFENLEHFIFVVTKEINMDTYMNVLPVENTPNKIVIKKVLDPVLKKVTVIVDMPTKKIVLDGFRLPLPFLFTESRISPVLMNLKNKIIHGNVPTGECMLTKENIIRTNDLMSIPLPENQCEVVLTKDCSHLNLFMVTAKKDITTNKKIVKVMILNKVLEITPTGTDFIVSVDGQTVTVRVGTPYLLRDVHTQEVLLKIMLNGQVLVVESPTLGVTIIKDMHAINIRTSPLYRGQLCGLCGDYNGDQDMTGPDMTVYKHRLDFIMSYSLPSATCDVKTISSNIHNTPDRTTRPVCEKIFRNVKEEREVAGVKNFCFSTEPVPRCPHNCEPINLHHVNKQFLCHPADETIAQTLLHKLDRRPFYLQPATGAVEVTDFVSQPETCRPTH